MKNICQSIINCMITFLYNFFFLYLSIKDEQFKSIARKFIDLFKNREVGEALFIILFDLIPVCLIIWLLGIIGKKLSKRM